MQVAVLKNIEINDLSKLYQEICKHIVYPASFVSQLKNTTVLEVDNEFIFKLLSECRDLNFISFDVDKMLSSVDKNIEEDISSKLNAEGLIVNPLGLTEAEKWFNSLSTEEKNHIEYLSHNFFNLLPVG